MLAYLLLERVRVAVKLFADLAVVRATLDERHMHRKIVGLLDTSNNLLDLVIEVFSSLFAHHKIMLKRCVLIISPYTKRRDFKKNMCV